MTPVGMKPGLQSWRGRSGLTAATEGPQTGPQHSSGPPTGCNPTWGEVQPRTLHGCLLAEPKLLLPLGASENILCESQKGQSHCSRAQREAGKKLRRKKRWKEGI